MHNRLLLIAALLLIGTACTSRRVRVRPNKVQIEQMPLAQAQGVLDRSTPYRVHEPVLGRDARDAHPAMWFAEDMTLGRYQRYRIKPDAVGFALYQHYEGEWHITRKEGAHSVLAVPTGLTEGQTGQDYAPFSPVVLGWTTRGLYVRLEQSGTRQQGSFLLPAYRPRFKRFDFSEFVEGELVPAGWIQAVTCEAGRRYDPMQCAVWLFPWNGTGLDLQREAYRIPMERGKPARIQLTE
jgi:hypothetical protein